jgi:hypothetical protein
MDKVDRMDGVDRVDGADKGDRVDDHGEPIPLGGHPRFNGSYPVGVPSGK